MPSHFHLVTLKETIFSHWNVNYFKTKHFFSPLHLNPIYACSQVRSLCQLGIPGLAAVFVSLREIGMRWWLLIVFVVVFFFFSVMHWAVSDHCFLCVCVCAWVCTILNLYTYVRTKGRYAWFAGCLFQSTRPIVHQGKMGGFREGSSGTFSCPGQFVSQIHNQAT